MPNLLRRDLQKTWEQLDKLPDWTVVLDKNGHAWQSANHGFWYRAFDGTGISPFELAQIAESVTVVSERPSSLPTESEQ